MLIILIPVLVILCTIVLALLISVRTERQMKNRHNWTFSFIQTARRLVEHIPQHRGMANGFLKGDVSFQEKILSLQAVIEEDFAAYRQVADHPLSVAETDSLQRIYSDWQSLKEQVFNLDPETSFDRHSLLVSKLLDQIEDVCELTSLHEYNDGNVLLVRALVTDLPRLTESLGQARGLGAGVAAQAHLSVAEQLKLKFLTDKCNDIFENTIGPLLNSNSKVLASQKAEFRACLEKGRGFINTVRNELINAEEISIESTQYYSDATQAIEESFSLFDSLLLAVKK